MISESKPLVMRYIHDCDECIPIGQYGDSDLYFCTEGGAGKTVIARYGDEGPEYTSGIA